jgi:hypothetical protein
LRRAQIISINRGAMLRELKTFLAVAQHGTFAAAGCTSA